MIDLRVAVAEPLTEQQDRVDRAVVRALEWLAKEQQPSGAWRIDMYGESTAATSLAVMAFLASGHVPGEGPYAEHLHRGIEFVLDHQEESGMLVHKTSHGPMYDHGISTLMLAEVAGMVGREQSPRVRSALERAIKLILSAQDVPKNAQHAGGWRYSATTNESDLSVTGWQLLALRAARSVGCDVPAEAIDRAVAYVKNCADDRGFGYMPRHDGTPTLSGVGMLALEVCGEHHAAETLAAADRLVARPLQFQDRYYFYGVYYCTVGLFKVGGEHWEEGREPLVTTLLRHQNANSSWTCPHGSERGAGPVYCTSLAVLALAVEYQYLPIYQR